jgi:endoribonuclease Nob1
MDKLKFVLDASGIIRSDMDYSLGGYGVPPSVLSELRGETAKTAIEEGIRSGSVKVLTIGEAGLRKAYAAAQETGDISALSQPDLDVLACAVEYGLKVVSDDYAIQNTAARLGVAVVSTTQEPIRRRIEWKWSCGGCGKAMDGSGVCGVCGHKARKKPSSRTP